MSSEFQIKLKQLREERDLSQYDFARMFGVSQGAVGNWESGKREPKHKTTVRIADFFGVTTDYLLGREPLDTKKDSPPSKEDEPPVDDPVIAQIMDVVRQMSPEERRLYLENLKTLRLLQAQGRKPDIQE